MRGNAPSFIPTSLSHKSPTPKEKPVQGEAKVRRETQAYWGTPAHHGAQARRGPQVRQEVQPAMHKQGPNQKPAARQPFRERKTMFYDKSKYSFALIQTTLTKQQTFPRRAVRNEGTWPSSRRCIVMDTARMRLSAAPWLRFLSSMQGEEMEARRPEGFWCITPSR